MIQFIQENCSSPPNIISSGKPEGVHNLSEDFGKELKDVIQKNRSKKERDEKPIDDLAGICPGVSSLTGSQIENNVKVENTADTESRQSDEEVIEDNKAVKKTMSVDEADNQSLNGNEAVQSATVSTQTVSGSETLIPIMDEGVTDTERSEFFAQNEGKGGSPEVKREGMDAAGIAQSAAVNMLENSEANHELQPEMVNIDKDAATVDFKSAAKTASPNETDPLTIASNGESQPDIQFVPIKENENTPISTEVSVNQVFPESEVNLASNNLPGEVNETDDAKITIEENTEGSLEAKTSVMKETGKQTESEAFTLARMNYAKYSESEVHQSSGIINQQTVSTGNEMAENASEKNTQPDIARVSENLNANKLSQQSEFQNSNDITQPSITQSESNNDTETGSSSTQLITEVVKDDGQRAQNLSNNQTNTKEQGFSSNEFQTQQMEEQSTNTTSETDAMNIGINASPVQTGTGMETQSIKFTEVTTANLQQIVQEVKLSLQLGKSTARIQLNPKNLGTIDIQLSSDANGVGITIMAENASTGRMLEAQIESLRQSLNDAGLNLNHISFEMKGDNTHREGQSFQNNQTAGGLGWNRKLWSDSENGTNTAIPSLLTMTSSLIDYRV